MAMLRLSGGVPTVVSFRFWTGHSKVTSSPRAASSDVTAGRKRGVGGAGGGRRAVTTSQSPPRQPAEASAHETHVWRKWQWICYLYGVHERIEGARSLHKSGAPWAPRQSYNYEVYNMHTVIQLWSFCWHTYSEWSQMRSFRVNKN